MMYTNVPTIRPFYIVADYFLLAHGRSALLMQKIDALGPACHPCRLAKLPSHTLRLVSAMSGITK